MFYQDNVILKGNKAKRVNFIPVEEEKPLTITLEELEKDINNMTYLGCLPQYTERNFVTEKLAIPMFIDSFYDFIYEEMRVPRQKEFWEHYIKTNNGVLFERDNKVYINYLSTHTWVDSTAYKGKLLRTYPSLLRDFHMWVMLNDDEFFKDKVTYSLWEDRDKVDITVYYENKPYFIGLDVSTKMCDTYREKKQHRHGEKDVKYFSIDLSQGKTLGHSTEPSKRFVLYPKSTLEEIKKYIRSKSL